MELALRELWSVLVGTLPARRFHPAEALDVLRGRYAATPRPAGLAGAQKPPRQATRPTDGSGTACDRRATCRVRTTCPAVSRLTGLPLDSTAAVIAGLLRPMVERTSRRAS